MNVLNAIKGVVCLLDNEVLQILQKTQMDEFIPIVDLDDNVDAFYDSLCISYTYRPYDGTHAYVKVSVYHDGDVTIYYNHDGSLRSGVSSNFTINSTEEDLFMYSTVQDNFDISVKEIKIFKQVWEMYC